MIYKAKCPHKDRRRDGLPPGPSRRRHWGRRREEGMRAARVRLRAPPARLVTTPADVGSLATFELRFPVLVEGSQAFLKVTAPVHIFPEAIDPLLLPPSQALPVQHGMEDFLRRRH